MRAHKRTVKTNAAGQSVDGSAQCGRERSVDGRFPWEPLQCSCRDHLGTQTPAALEKGEGPGRVAAPTSP